MKLAIACFHHKRPILSDITISSLNQCIGLELFDVYHFIDFFDKKSLSGIVNVIHKYNTKSVIYRSDRNIGVNQSLKHGLYKCLQDHDAVIGIEDDNIFHKDALLFFYDLYHKLHDDFSYFAVCGLNNKWTPKQGGESREVKESYVDKYEDFYFIGGVYMFWKNRSKKLFNELRTFDKHPYSFDYVLATDKNIKCAVPKLARVQNIGGTGGTYTPGAARKAKLSEFEFHRINHSMARWMGNTYPNIIIRNFHYDNKD